MNNDHDERVKFIIESEILGSDPTDLAKSLVATWNFLYRICYKGMVYFLLVLLFILAPFIGLAGGVADMFVRMWRVWAVPSGRLFADSFGYGELIRKQIEKIDLEMAVLRNQLGVIRTPAPGGIVMPVNPNTYQSPNLGYPAAYVPEKPPTYN